MRILLIGANGQLGWELNRTLLTLGELTSVDFPQINLADMGSVRSLIREIKPGIIVNAAAYTNVDKAESEPELVRKINALAPGLMAEEACKLNAALIHYSTDYVFDGIKGSPYIETDSPNPLNIYGKSKLEGEIAVQQVGGAYLIFRTSWVYSLRQGGFVNKVLSWAREQETLRIVDDQIGSPTWVRTLAEATSQVIAQGRGDPASYLMEKGGLYHLAGSGSCSRYEWAKMILELDPKREELLIQKLLPAKSRDFPTLAIRPGYSGLDTKKIWDLSIYLPIWDQSLKSCLSY